MKAISIKEPWASLIKDGKKTIETRTWHTKHRGKMLLCCSKTPKSEISGTAFAVADLVNVRPMTSDDENDAMCGIYPKAHSWVLKKVTPITPFSVTGQLGLFEVDIDWMFNGDGQ